MKHIYVTFEDGEHRQLRKQKANKAGTTSSSHSPRRNDEAVYSSEFPGHQSSPNWILTKQFWRMNSMKTEKPQFNRLHLIWIVPVAIALGMIVGYVVGVNDTIHALRQTRFSGVKDPKHRLQAAVSQIIPVRNEIAHVREIERDRLLRASVACADILEILKGMQARG